MLKKRVIFTLLYDNGSFVLSRNFRLQKVGDINWLHDNYNFSRISFSIDELLVLDVSRNGRDDEKFNHHVKALTEDSFVPIAAGGGIKSIDRARTLLQSGADKIVINSTLSSDPQLVHELASEFGRQCIIASIDVKSTVDGYVSYKDNGCIAVGGHLDEWLQQVVSLPVGEIYLNSIDRDGTGQGYNFDLLDYLPAEVSVPIIIAGGAGNYQHMY